MILTTSQLLTTGVDAPDRARTSCSLRVVNSMTEFKQIIGRGTRVRDDYGKLFFNILDYTGSATRLFADPDFDGDPVDRDRSRRSTTKASPSTRQRSITPEDPRRTRPRA